MNPTKAKADKLKELTDRLETGIQELFESDRYREYLDVMSKFHHYSVNNTLLIAMQKPDASFVAGYNAWRDKFGRNVKKGEKAIQIIAPTPYKAKRQVEKTDSVTHRPILGADGKPITEEQEITIPSYKVVSVFDVSQTEGRELPTIATNLKGDIEQYGKFLAAIQKASPVPISFEKISGRANGYYSPREKRIVIDEGMSELQTLKTAIHEAAHAKLHDIDLSEPKAERANPPDQFIREVQAESVAYVVSQHYGIDTSDYSFGYIAGWSSSREMPELKASLLTIRDTAADIIDGVDRYFALQKERGCQKKPDSEIPGQSEPGKQPKKHRTMRR